MRMVAREIIDYTGQRERAMQSALKQMTIASFNASPKTPRRRLTQAEATDRVMPVVEDWRLDVPGGPTCSWILQPQIRVRAVLGSLVAPSVPFFSLSLALASLRNSLRGLASTLLRTLNPACWSVLFGTHP
ncbi:hypothetical protein VDGL01_00712 [Verticillium dahliae]